MKIIFRMLAATLLLAVFAGTANATYIEASWSHTYDPNPDLRVPPSRTYTHDLTLDGFRPGTDLVTSFSLAVYLFDDNDSSWERALIDVPGGSYDYRFNTGGAAYGGWSLTGWLWLNLTGTYTVTIESLAGDFLFGASRLDAQGYRWGGYQAVPEPGTLALLALGIIGMGVALSRRRSTNRKD